MLASGDLLAIFLSTPSARRATHQVDHVRHIGVISIHALREEGDWVLASAMLAASIFLSTPSARRATLHNPATNVGRLQFLSTPSARRATQTRSYEDKNGQFLSTPSARRATLVLCISLKEASISIHALREEGDQSCFVEDVLHFYFYPRPPRGGRRGHSDNCRLVDAISIHALREEGDRFQQMMRDAGKGFLSTPSARRATPPDRGAGAAVGDFYPRPPRGGRRGTKELWLNVT